MQQFSLAIKTLDGKTLKIIDDEISGDGKSYTITLITKKFGVVRENTKILRVTKKNKLVLT
jgi:hypothetical protein